MRISHDNEQKDIFSKKNSQFNQLIKILINSIITIENEKERRGSKLNGGLNVGT